MKVLREVGNILEAELTEEEFSTVDFNKAVKSTHPHVYFTVNGFTIRLTLASSPSDRRWQANFRSKVRRYVGAARDGKSPYELRQSERVGHG